VPTICSGGCAISGRVSAGVRPARQTKLQQEANQGAVGLIVARRKQDGKSGHIVAVSRKPTPIGRAQRCGRSHEAAASQAGVVNFRRGTSTLETGGRAINSRKVPFGCTPDRPRRNAQPARIGCANGGKGIDHPGSAQIRASSVRLPLIRSGLRHHIASHRAAY